MNTSARLCASCGSPLPDVAPGILQVKCSFCGVVNDLAPATAPPVTIHVSAGDAARAAATVGRTGTRIAVFAVTLAMAGAGLGLYVATRSVTQITQSLADAAVRETPPRAIAPAELVTSSGSGWQTLDVQTPSTAWAAFDPVADLEWAMTIARAWHDDALLTRIDVSRLTPDGTVNLEGSSDDSAGYRFVSPSQLDEWSRMARRGDSDPEVGHQLMIKLSQRAVTAIVVRGRPTLREQPPKAIDSLSLKALMQTARRLHGFGEALFFDGYMTHLEREGWVWYLQGRGMQGSLPRVRARDGLAYPYRR